MNDIEFYLLLSQCDNNVILDFDNYRISVYEDYAIIDFNNESDFDDAVTNQYYIYYIDEDYYDEDLSIKLILKPIFKNFDDTKLLTKSICYQHLYGVTINKEIKRLIMFLLNLGKQEQKNYLKQCPEDVKNSLVKYFSLIYGSEDSNENEESYQRNEDRA